MVLGGATYAALSAARLVAAEADEPCWPASATSPPLLGQSRRAPFTRRLTAFSAVPVTDLASHINAAPAPFTAPPWGEAPLPNEWVEPVPSYLQTCSHIDLLTPVADRVQVLVPFLSLHR